MPLNVRKPTKKVLEAIIQGLEEMDASFGFSKVLAEAEQQPPDDADPAEIGGNDFGEDDLGNDGADDGYVDREEIEVAIDSFLSALINSGVIRKNKWGKAPLFSDVFTRFFGGEHEITAKAIRFEEHVKGYFGWINPEDMDLARDEFSEVYDLVEKAKMDLDAD